MPSCVHKKYFFEAEFIFRINEKMASQTFLRKEFHNQLVFQWNSAHFIHAKCILGVVFGDECAIFF